MRWKEIIGETATAGASAAGGVATVAQPLGGIQRRTGTYTNHTVVGPDGRPWKKKKKKQRTDEQIQPGDPEYDKIKDEGYRAAQDWIGGGAPGAASNPYYTADDYGSGRDEAWEEGYLEGAAELRGKK